MTAGRNVTDKDRVAIGQSIPHDDTGDGKTGVPAAEPDISNRPGDREPAGDGEELPELGEGTENGDEPFIDPAAEQCDFFRLQPFPFGGHLNYGIFGGYAIDQLAFATLAGKYRLRFKNRSASVHRELPFLLAAGVAFAAVGFEQRDDLVGKVDRLGELLVGLLGAY